MADYTTKEEQLNIISHAIGFVLSIVALILLMIRAAGDGDNSHLLSVAVFGVSLIVLYGASTLYHSAKQKESRYKLKVFDHAAIYALIAGTYTPFAMITLDGTTGWTVFSVSWAMAFVGITVKLFFTGRYNTISTIMYILMGWMIVFAIKPLIANLPIYGIYWLVAGGVSYTLGAVIYSIDRINFNHAIFHVFVLAGSFCHFNSVYFYVLVN